jgi:hypothetical protein
MSDAKNNDRSSALAAGLVLFGFAAVLLGLPTIVLWIGNYSPALAAVVGTVGIMSFFAVLWLRARYQRNHAPKD